MTVEERWDAVKKQRRCMSCLQPSHQIKDCKKKKPCGRNGCKYHHHPLLHDNSLTKTKSQVTFSQTPPVTEGSGLGANSIATAITSPSLPIIPVRISGPKGIITVNALLDTGANVNLLEAAAAKSIGLEGVSSPFSFTVYGKDVREEASSELIDLSVSGAFRKATSFKLPAVRTVKSLGLPGISLDVESLKKKFSFLRRCTAKSVYEAVPQMIIGWKASRLFAPREILEDPEEDSPVAYRSLLGWYLCVGGDGIEVCSFMHHPASQDDDDLENLVKSHFSLENMGVVLSESNRSKEDNQALEQMEKTTTRIGDRWETGLPYRDLKMEFPSSKPMAPRRLHSMELKMDKDPSFAALCQEKFQEYIDKGFLVPCQDLYETPKKQWYLPWFFSFSPSKPPRLIFDAAAKHKTTDGKSLNCFLLKGPDLLRPLAGVLMRFRRHQYAITGDIKQMFHQVSLKPEDRCSQTILFRGVDRSSPPKEYEMTVLFFGSASSPSSAIFVKEKNAIEFQNVYPEAVNTILYDEYMDDHLSGADTIKDAIRLREEVTEIHGKGGFPMVKWNSNSAEVMSSVPEEIRQVGAMTFDSKDEIRVEKTLGMYWNPQDDNFQFSLNLKKVPDEIKNGIRPPTKRQILSITMSIFDPLGFLAPLKMKATSILQNTWKEKLKWEDKLDGDILDEWYSWMEILRSVSDIRIPRKFTSFPLPESDSIQLHVFCDASDEAYASVIYLRARKKDQVEVSFIFGKSRVGPLRGQTIPRLELQAALLGARMLKFVRKAVANELRIENTFLWSDSRIVLAQLRSTTARFKTFVSNRINEILDITKKDTWLWVPTGENPADDGTRSHKVEVMQTSSRWITGPSFLALPQHQWPKETTTASLPDDAMELKLVSAALVKDEHPLTLLLGKFSCWYRLLRATAAVRLGIRRFKNRVFSLPENEESAITVEDMEWARLEWIRIVQQDSFAEEIHDLKDETSAKGEVGKTSRLFNLSPKLNADGVIVLGGRIEAASLRTAVKQPPILPSNHPYVELMVDYFHRRSGHFGQERVINELRQHVWIIGCRNAVRRCWRNCKTCKIRNASPIQQEMGQLPPSRFEKTFPFAFTMVDLFGPFSVAVGRSRQKRWGALFTCLSTRAVHLELVDSLNSDDMINCYTRFINIRGSPIEIRSDNGTNFVGAAKELKEAWKEWNLKTAPQTFASKEIRWKFNPPGGCHFGGAVERLVGLTKRILDILLKEKSPREGILRTIFTEVMSILNSRPLTRASPDPNDLDCLTPNHFLLLRAVEKPSVIGDFSDGDKSRKSWKFAQYISDGFWKRFQREYIPTLIKRQKWIRKGRRLQIGDLVLVVDEQAHRNQWRRGRVVDTFPGNDGQVRVVNIEVVVVDPDDPKKTPKVSVLKRPVVKVCPID